MSCKECERRRKLLVMCGDAIAIAIGTYHMQGEKHKAKDYVELWKEIAKLQKMNENTFPSVFDGELRND